MAAMARAIALTGDVGAGKSTVAGLLEGMGGVRLDADAIALEQWRRPEVARAAARRWGRRVLDPSGGIVRGTVAGRIFTDRAEYDWACGLIHPLVMAELERRVAELSPDRWAVAEVPLLFEVGRPAWVTAAVFVTAPRALRIARCRERGWGEDELTRREAFYLPSDERMALSDFVLNNEGDLASLRRKAEAIVREIASRGFLNRCVRTNIGEGGK